MYRCSILYRRLPGHGRSVPPTPITSPRLWDPAIRVPHLRQEGASMVVSPTHTGTTLHRMPRRRRIGILDLVTKSPRNSLYGRLMNANLASIMPQVLAVWCEEAGHDVSY